MKLNELFEAAWDVDEILERAKKEFLTDPQEITEWLDVCGWRADRFTIVDGLVNMPDAVNWSSKGFTRLPFRMGVVDGSFMVSGNNLTALEGCPHTIRGRFSCSKNRGLSSLVGVPRKMDSFYCTNTNVQSLVGIADMIDTVDGVFNISADQITEGGIGLMLIRGISAIYSDLSGDAKPKWAEIVNKYMGRPNDIFECQAELIEAGLEQHAIL